LIYAIDQLVVDVHIDWQNRYRTNWCAAGAA
jgi:hypothetical protein